MQGEPHLSDWGEECPRQRVVVLQDPIKIVGTLRDAILHSPDRMTQTHLFQRSSEFGKDKAHHLAPPGLVGGMNPPKWAEVNGKVTPPS